MRRAPPDMQSDFGIYHDEAGAAEAPVRESRMRNQIFLEGSTGAAAREIVSPLKGIFVAVSVSALEVSVTLTGVPGDGSSRYQHRPYQRSAPSAALRMDKSP